MLTRQEFFSRARRGCGSTEQLYSAYEAYSTCPAVANVNGFQCQRCGNCCKRPWRVEASLFDVQRWVGERRLDIIEALEYKPKRGPPGGLSQCEMKVLEMICMDLLEQDESLFSKLAFMLAASREGAMIVSKKSGQCVFHMNGACAIYETRPEVCIRFPDAGLFKGLAALIQ